MPAALAVLAACAGQRTPAAPAPTSESPAPTAAAVATTSASTATPATRTEKWIDLAVGDCLADAPSADPSALTVTIVDCTTAHHAEVYLRAPVAVNAAIADVASQRCAAGFLQYTGRSLYDSPYTVSYLIDSNQDRTSADPTPSTVICLLQGADGQALSGSARR